MSKIKQHLKKYHVEYIIGGTVVLGLASLALYYKRVGQNPNLRNLAYADKIVKADPTINPMDLQFADVVKKRFFTLVPSSVPEAANFDEIVDKYVGPLVFGPATVVVHKDRGMVGVFAR